METRTTAEHQRIAFGEFLRQARERRRLTLEQIAGETKIAPRLLTSLEQGNVQPMPKGMYRRAMLRAYAESVGLDTEAALTEFERTFEEPPARETPLPTLPVPSPRHESARIAPWARRAWPLVMIAVGLAVAIALGVWTLTSDSPQVVATDDQLTNGTAPAAQPVTAAPPQSTPARAPEAAATSGALVAAASTPASAAAPAPATPLATEGQLVVLSEPPGARVTVNGVGWGSTPLTIKYLPLGQKRVRLTMSGYVSEERTVRVDGLRPNATVRVALKERR
jgi:cytoskeleton protein RodZ